MNFITLLQYILAAGALLGLILAYLLFTRKPNQLANRLLSVLLILMALQSFLVAFDTQNFFIRFSHLSKISWLIPMLFGPLLYLYIRKLTARNPRLYPIEIIHFLPVFLALFYLIPYFIRTNGETVAYLSDLQVNRQDDFGLIRQITLFQVLFYLVYSLKSLARYKARIFNTFSDLENIKLEWLKKVIFLLLVIFAGAVLAIIIQNMYLPVLTELYHYYLHFLLVISCVYWIGLKSLGQKQLFFKNSQTIQHAPPENNEVLEEDLSPVSGGEKASMEIPGLPKNYRKYTLKPSAIQKYYERLNEIMETEKPYRQSNLTIQELADRLQMPRQYLLYLIRGHLDKTFYDFINQYRLADAQTLLTTSPEQTIQKQTIAKEAGFSSEMAMEAAFLRLTGQSSEEYLKSSGSN